MKPILEVQHITKQFKIGAQQERYLSLRDLLANPFKKKKNVDQTFFALNDVNFDVYPGESIGIIGRNGAGKSTLLKILSKITPPSSGKIICRGRVASLLEVGTGFHPELSGRENIYMNGSILGMRKFEIDKHFEAIVDFSGIEQFLDTPLKRYSSGMQLRLAFAVAAFLEPEILIIDEVLAVGDAEFQKKCLGKMDEVSKSGRTVLFVSHNMETVLQLCDRCILLEKGTVKKNGTPSETIDYYLSNQKNQDEVIDLSNVIRTGSFDLKQNARFRSVKLDNIDNAPWQIKYKQTITLKFEIDVINDVQDLEIGIAISTISDFEIISSLSTDCKKIENLKKGTYSFDFVFPELTVLPGIYKIGIGLRSDKKMEDYLKEVGQFEILVSKSSSDEKANTRKGIIVPKNIINRS
ncbi:MAG: ABC transporter ATP-binding protein [Bacteroidota bacterium]|nr:ABC transporter ATP-binding protein [Bacteroidota bacterium]